MRFVGRGHPAIRATHGKTLELSPDAEITARATCVVAVATEAQPAAPMAGPVRLRITAGAERFSVDAVANPSWDPAGPVVIRRSPLRLPGTFATGADATSADLPRALVATLQDPTALVTVDVVARPQDVETVVLFAADPSGAAASPGLVAELARADTVHALDAGARRLVGLSLNSGGGASDGGAGRRHLVVATAGLPRLLGRPDARVETVGLSAGLAAAAASPTGGTLVLAEPDVDPRELLRSTPATHRLVLTAGAERLPRLLALAREIRGSSACVIAQEFAPPQRLADGAVADLASRDDVHVCFDARTADEALDPGVRAAVEGLLADGVSTRTAADALARLTGWPRRRAYDLVVSLRST